MDGALTLTEIANISQNSSKTLSDDRNIVGLSLSPSFNQVGAAFLMRLSSVGGIDYCKLTASESGQLEFDHNETFEDFGEVLDFSHLSEQYSKELRKEPNPFSREPKENFGYNSQSTFHLDFYWDELKSIISKNE